MYGDFDKSNPAALDRLSKQLRDVYPKAMLGSSRAETPESFDRGLSGWRRWVFAGSGSVLQKNSTNQTQTTNPSAIAVRSPATPSPSPSNSATQPVGAGQASTTGGQSVNASGNNNQVLIGRTSQIPNFLELCVNVDSFEIRLGEISLSSINTDQSLFDAIWKRYRETRGWGIRQLFVKPSDINFVQVRSASIHYMSLSE